MNDVYNLVDEYLLALTRKEFTKAQQLKREVAKSLTTMEDPFSVFLYIISDAPMMAGLDMTEDMFEILMEFAYIKLRPTRQGKRTIKHLLFYGKQKFGYDTVLMVAATERERALVADLKLDPAGVDALEDIGTKTLSIGDGVEGILYYL